MKNWSIFAVSSPKTFINALGRYFHFTASGEHRYQGLAIPDDYRTQRRGKVFGEIGDSTALFLYPYFNFSFMPKTMKNCGTVNHSTRTSTSAHDTSIATIQLPVSNPYSIPCFEDFIDEACKRFEAEKNAKNKAYAFIISRGLLSEFTEYSRTCSGECQSIESKFEMILKNC